MPGRYLNKIGYWYTLQCTGSSILSIFIHAYVSKYLVGTEPIRLVLTKVDYCNFDDNFN
jgi:hypothetical protein